MKVNKRHAACQIVLHARVQLGYDKWPFKLEEFKMLQGKKVDNMVG